MSFPNEEGLSAERTEDVHASHWFFEKRGTRNWKSLLRFFLWQFLFNGHIAEFAGIKDLAAQFTLYVFGVFIARDYAHSGVLTGVRHAVSWGWSGWEWWAVPILKSYAEMQGTFRLKHDFGTEAVPCQEGFH